MEDSKKYQAEYAKTGRAGCKACKEKIDQGTLRIAVMVQSAFHDGKQPNWYHEKCFFIKQRPQSVEDIGNFEKLRTEDQKRIKDNLGNPGSSTSEETKSKKGKKRASAKDSTVLKDFNIEYSKSSRAVCRVCDIRICKDEIRVSKTVYDTEIAMKYGGQAMWHHLKCFAEEKTNLDYLAPADDIPGFKNLSKEDQEIVRKEISNVPSGVPPKKIKEAPKDKEEVKKEKDLEKNLQKQNKMYFKYRDSLINLKKSDLHQLLEANSQEVLSGVNECLDHLADCMVFGALEPCPECDQGQLILKNSCYRCTGNLSEWTKCSYSTQNPKRKPMVIPSQWKKEAIFKKYNPVVGVRLFSTQPTPTVTTDKKAVLEKKERKQPPLKNIQFFIYGNIKKPKKEELKNTIFKMGGLVSSYVVNTLAAVISTKRHVEKMSMMMELIQSHGIQVVEESFIDLIDKENGTVAQSLDLIKEHNIAPWGSDIKTRVPQEVLEGKSIPKSGSSYVPGKSTSQKLKLKGGFAVDPDSRLEDEAHVYVDKSGNKYNVVLSKTDLVENKNSYYKLQVLEADDFKKYWFFRSWGRIGTTIGGCKTEKCVSVIDATTQFESHYMEKTQNPWECRNNFMKFPNAYYPVEMDYGEPEPLIELKQDSECKLPVPVQKLVMLIFDVQLMRKILVEFELDTEKMPLGKLSKKQITQGYTALTELLKHIEQGNGNKNKTLDYSNRFYTIIPHDFGTNNPPLLDDIEAINKKKEMLDSLFEIEIAYNLLKTESNDSNLSPIESHYLKLKSEIVPLDPSSPEYELINKYVTNTHGDTHRSFNLKIEQVFKVVRDGEEKRFKPFKKLHNRRLLWHGSRVTNFAGILSQGLRIAPPEAPVTGYMFGKGIYFADMVSKSANYCCTNKSYPVGIMLLCEVALGNMKKCTKADHVTKLPPEYNSVWGMGSSEPNPDESHKMEDGVIVPLGKAVQKDLQTSLLYNEFIVYDVAQVKVKYLLQMQFDFKYGR